MKTRANAGSFVYKCDLPCFLAVYGPVSMIADKNIEQEAAQWFAAQRRGAMSLDERQTFDAWRTDPEHQAALNRMHEVWGEVSMVSEMGVRPRQRESRYNRAAIAAALVLGVVISVSGGAWWSLDRQTDQTDIGEQRSQELGDGSVVALNVMTRARYDINDRARLVYLNDGEATFLVHKDPARPFLVRAAGFDIRAVGTVFNVRNRGHSLDVAVKEGVVEVRRSGQSQSVTLRAGQRFQINDTRLAAVARWKVTDIDPVAVDEWRDRVLTFENVAVSQVVEEFNRFYDRPVVVDPAMARRRVTVRLVMEDRSVTVKRLADLLNADVSADGRADTLRAGT